MIRKGLPPEAGAPFEFLQDEKGRICAPDALREGQKMTLCGAVNRIHCTVDAVEGPNESTQEL